MFIYTLHRKFTEKVLLMLATVTESDLTQNSEKTLNANTGIAGRVEWIPLSSPKLSLAFTYTYKLTNSDKKLVSSFSKLLCFLCPAWPKLRFISQKLSLYSLGGHLIYFKYHVNHSDITAFLPMLPYEKNEAYSPHILLTNASLSLWQMVCGKLLKSSLAALHLKRFTPFNTLPQRLKSSLKIPNIAA